MVPIAVRRIAVRRIAVRRIALTCLLCAFALCLPAFAPRASAQNPTPHSWTTTSTQSGTWSYDAYGTHQSGTWNPGPLSGGGGMGVGGGEKSNGTVSGTVTSTLRWTPAAGKTLVSDPAPNPLFVLEHGYAWWSSVWGNSPSPPTQADTAGSAVSDGFGDLPVFAVGNTSATSTGYRLEQRGFSSGICQVSDTVKAVNPPYAQTSGWPPSVKWTSGYNSTSFNP